MITNWMVVETIFWLSATLLIYTYVLYPLLAICLGRGHVQQVVEELPGVSILVPAHNEETVVAAKIQNFLDLDYPPERCELVIVDDGSDDKTVDAAKVYLDDRIRLVRQKKRSGKAAAMNRLVDAASYHLLLFTDANVLMAPGAIRRLVEPLCSPHVGAVTGEVRLIGSDVEFGVGEALYYWMERRIQGAESRLGSVMGVDGGMYLIRRVHWSDIPMDTILDDFFVSMNVIRARKRVVYESAAKAFESGTPTAREEFSRRTRIAAGAIQLIKRGMLPHWYQPVLWFQFVSHKLLRWCSPFIFCVLLISSALLATAHNLFLIALMVQLSFHAMFFLACAIPRIRRRAIGGVLFYFGLSQIAMAVGIGKGLLNRQPPQWSKGQRKRMIKGLTDSGEMQEIVPSGDPQHANNND